MHHLTLSDSTGTSSSVSFFMDPPRVSEATARTRLISNTHSGAMPATPDGSWTDYPASGSTIGSECM